MKPSSDKHCRLERNNESRGRFGHEIRQKQWQMTGPHARASLCRALRYGEVAERPSCFRAPQTHREFGSLIEVSGNYWNICLQHTAT